MRWKVPTRPQHGEERTLQLFAWRPTKIDSETVIWLESYYELQRFYRAKEVGQDKKKYFKDTWVPISATIEKPPLV